MRQWLIITLVSVLTLTGILGACAPSEVTTPPEEVLPEITLADAPAILDLSSELSGDFVYDTSQKMPTYTKLGLGPWSEWHIWQREGPFQCVSVTMTILSSEAERNDCDETLQNSGGIRSIFIESYQDDENWDLVSIDVRPTDVGDEAVLISMEKTTQGYLFQGRNLYFRCQDVVVLLHTLHSIEAPPIIELARIIEQRIPNY